MICTIGRTTRINMAYLFEGRYVSGNPSYFILKIRHFHNIITFVSPLDTPVSPRGSHPLAPGIEIPLGLLGNDGLLSISCKAEGVRLVITLAGADTPLAISSLILHGGDIFFSGGIRTQIGRCPYHRSFE
jgi:hypothetical protein